MGKNWNWKKLKNFTNFKQIVVDREGTAALTCLEISTMRP
jgi:hypothetical protein